MDPWWECSVALPSFLPTLYASCFVLLSVLLCVPFCLSFSFCSPVSQWCKEDTAHWSSRERFLIPSLVLVLSVSDWLCLSLTRFVCLSLALSVSHWLCLWLTWSLTGSFCLVLYVCLWLALSLTDIVSVCMPVCMHLSQSFLLLLSTVSITGVDSSWAMNSTKFRLQPAAVDQHLGVFPVFCWQWPTFWTWVDVFSSLWLLSRRTGYQFSMTLGLANHCVCMHL